MPGDSERETILKRLEELGPEKVQALMSHGGLPTHWTATIYEWLTVKRSEEDNARH